MLICGLDLEATSLDIETARIIEIGAVLWDTNKKLPMVIQSLLVNIGEPLTTETTSITNIDDSMLSDFGFKPDACLKRLNNLMEMADYIVAHNGKEYDKKLYEVECSRHGIPVVEKHWLDTLVDVNYPPHVKSKRLNYLASDHGFLNPFPHRAVFDVLTMLKIISEYDIAPIIEESKIPVIKLIAIVSYDNRERVKANGFMWNGSDKTWWKNIKANLLPEEEEKASLDGCYKVKVAEYEHD